MTSRVRRAAAAAITAACLTGIAAPAFAKDGPPAPTPAPVLPQAPVAATPGDSGSGSGSGSSGQGAASGSSDAVASPPADAPKPVTPAPVDPGTAQPSAAPKTPGVEVVGYLRTLISKVEAAPIDSSVKNALLARLRSARDSFVAGNVVDNATMQQLIRDVAAALGMPAGSDAPGKGGTGSGKGGAPVAPGAPAPGSDDPAGATAGEPNEAKPEDGPRKEGVLRLLTAAIDKVTNATIDDSVKSALLERLQATKASIGSGTALAPEQLGQLVRDVKAALGEIGKGRHSEGAEVEAPKGDAKGGDPRQRALDTIDRQIDRVTHSDLPDAVKSQILAELASAREKVASGQAADGATVRKALDDHRAAKLDQLTTRLTAAADRIAGALKELAANDPTAADFVAGEQAKLDAAVQQLQLAATPDDLRAAWAALRQIRIDLSERAESAAAAGGASGSAAQADPSTTAVVGG